MNMLRAIHPEVKKLTNLLQSHTKANISYDYQSLNLELIRNLVLDALKKGKRTAIVCSNHLEKRLIHEDLKLLGLDNLFYDLTANEGVFTAKDLNFEELLRNHQAKSVDINYLNHIQSISSPAKASLSKSYKLLAERKFESASWQQLVDFKALMDRNQWSSSLSNEIDLSLLEWTMDEFIELKQELRQKVFHFKPHFSSLNERALLTSDYYAFVQQDEKNIDASILKIRELCIQFIEINNAIKEQSERERSLRIADEAVLFNQIKMACANLNGYKSLKNYLKERKRITPLKTGLLGFDKNPIDIELEELENKTKEALKIINEHTSLDHILLSEFEAIDFNAIKNSLNEIYIPTKVELEDLVFEVNSEFESLTELIKEINQLNWFTQTLKVESTHPTTLMFEIQNLILFFKKAEYFILNNDDFIAWKSSKTENKKALDQILDALQYEDSEDWESIFENWYLVQVIDNGFNHQFIEAFDYESYLNQQQEEQETTYHFLQHFWRSQKVWASKTFDKQQVEVRRMLNSQISRINVEVAMLSYGKLIASYFPICLIDEKRTTKNLDILNSWEYIFSVDSNELVKRIGKAKIPSGKKFIALNSITNPNSQTVDFHLAGKGFVTNDHELNRVERAKILSAALMEYGKPSKIYQTSSKTIISYWSNPKNEILERAFSSLNELNIEHDLLPTINDILIDNTRQCIILNQDGLLQLNREKEPFSQIEFIQYLQQNNIEIRTLWSKDYYLIGKELIHSLLADISEEKQQEQSEKRSLESLELKAVSQ